MFKVRNLLAIGIAVFMLAAVMIPFVAAQPALQTTDTPTATLDLTGTAAATSVATSTLPADTATPEATSTTLATSVATTTLSAATVTPEATSAVTATAVGTPSTLPRTGGSDDGSLLVSLALLILAAVLVLGGLGLALSRRAR